MTRRACSILVLLLICGFAADAHALRCPDGLVGEGDRRFEVERKCGEPSYVEAVRDPVYARYSPHDESWHYNFGPRQMLRILHFRDGRLRRIDTAGYGFREGEIGADRPCRPADFSTGMTAYELLASCGEPVEQSYSRVSPPREWRNRHGHHQRTVEDWYYHQDERYKPRRVRILDGVVVDVSTRLN